MGKELFDQKKNFVMVYVGEKTDTEKYPFKIITTSEKFDKGTLEYLRQG